MKIYIFTLWAFLFTNLAYSKNGPEHGLKSVHCHESSLKDFQSRLQKKGVRHIVFFASWCLGCKQHLEEANLAETAFVVAFDKVDRAIKALQAAFSNKYFAEIDCETDPQEEILNMYGVKSLPFRVRFQGQENAEPTKSHK